MYKTLTLTKFNKIRFPVFLYVKPLDEAGLIEAIPTVDWNHQKVVCLPIGTKMSLLMKFSVLFPLAFCNLYKNRL